MSDLSEADTSHNSNSESGKWNFSGDAGGSDRILVGECRYKRERLPQRAIDCGFFAPAFHARERIRQPIRAGHARFGFVIDR